MRSILFMMFVVFFIACKKNSSDESIINIAVFDWDARTPIPGAKVYSHDGTLITMPPDDSVITNSNGLASISTTPGAIHTISAEKPGYALTWINEFHSITAGNIMDTIFLAKASHVDITLHQANSYLTSDTVSVGIFGYRRTIPAYGMLLGATAGTQRRAIAADTVLHFPIAYFPPPFQKAYIRWEVLRSNPAVTVIRSGSDSVILSQYGTVNYTVNY